MLSPKTRRLIKSQSIRLFEILQEHLHCEIYGAPGIDQRNEIMKPKSLVLLGVSGAFGLIAAALLTKAIGQRSEGVETEKQTVVVALADLDINETLTAENVRTEQWPVSILPPGVAKTIEEINEKRINVRVAMGAPIFTRDLQDPFAPQILSIPRGKKIVGLRVPAADHIAGLLQPGHSVDVIGIFEGQNDQSFSRTFLRGIKVYSISNRTSPDMKEDIKADESDITVSLIVSEIESEKLTLVAGVAKIKLAVRGANELKEDEKAYDPASAQSEETVSLNEIMNINVEQQPAFDPLQSFNSQPPVQKEQPFRIQVVNGNVVTEYELSEGGLPRLVATSSVGQAEEQGNGVNLGSFTGPTEGQAGSENLEF